MRRLRLALLLLVAVPAGMVHGRDADVAPSRGDVERHLEELERHAGIVIDAVQDSRDARVLIAAASLALDYPLRAVRPALAARREALVDRARQHGADDPMVWWLLASHWPGLPSAQRADAARRLRQLAPNNAAAWLLKEETAAADADFARAARANRIDLYEAEYVRALHAAASMAPAPEFMLERRGAADGYRPDARLKLALMKWMERILPPVLEAVNTRCNGTLSLSGDRLEECLALGRLMTNRSRSILLQRLGTWYLLLRLPPGEERDAVEAARRRLGWMEEQVATVIDDEWPPGVERWLAPDGDELTATRAMLEAHGIPLDPPSNWRSHSEPVLHTPPPAD